VPVYGWGAKGPTVEDDFRIVLMELRDVLEFAQGVRETSGQRYSVSQLPLEEVYVPTHWWHFTMAESPSLVAVTFWDAPLRRWQFPLAWRSVLMKPYRKYLLRRTDMFTRIVSNEGDSGGPMAHALITGYGGNGLGRALAFVLAERGWSVTAVCRTNEQAAILGAETQGLAIITRELNLCDDSTIRRLPEDLATAGLELVVSNAVFARREHSLGDVERQTFLQAVEVNAFGALALERACPPLLAAGENPRFVAIGSTMGSFLDRDTTGRYAYRMSKAALNMGLLTLASDPVMAGIIAVSVHPGWVRTRLGGMDAPLSPQDAAERLARFIEGLGAEHHGGFFDSQGKRLAW